MGLFALTWVPRSLRRLHTSVTLGGGRSDGGASQQEDGATTHTVIHTTEVHCLGVCVMSSRETITLHDDGLGLSLQGQQRIAPLWWRIRPVGGSGQVAPSARATSYQLTWFGGELSQETTAEPDRVVLEQRASWMRGTQRLVRQG